MSASSPTEQRLLPLLAATLALVSLFSTALGAGPSWLGIIEPALAAIAFALAVVAQRRSPAPLSAAVALFCLLALLGQVGLLVLARA